MKPYIVVQTQVTEDGVSEIVDIWEILAGNANKAIDAVATATKKHGWQWFASSFGLQYHNPKAGYRHGSSRDFLNVYEDE